jgi:hypothetical protein
MALSVVPGAAHIDLGRAGRGLLIFALFAFSVNGALVAPLVLGAAGARGICVGAAAVLWVGALIDALRLSARAERKAEAPPPAAGTEKPLDPAQDQPAA